MDEIAPHVAIKLKNIFASIRKTDTAPFMFRNEPEVCADLEWFLKRYPMRMTDEDKRLLRHRRQDYETFQAELDRIVHPEYRPPSVLGLKEGKRLRDYQGQVPEVLARRGSLLLGDDIGLGKTISTIGCMMLPDALPAHIVVEGHVHQQWEDRIQQFTDLRTHKIQTTKPASLPEADVYLYRYSNIAGWVDVIADTKVGLVAWDEIQSLRKGTDSQKGRASIKLRDAARYRLGLTATPIYNYGSEIFEILSFIDPSVFGSYDEFYREWCGYMGRIRDPEALGSYLRERHVFLRRTRKDVGRELPPVNSLVEHVSHDMKAVKDAEALARQLAIKATTGTFEERGQATRELDVMMRHVTGVSKASSVAEFTRIVVESGVPVVLIGWHRDVYDIWLEKLGDFEPAMYTGSETNTKKLKELKRFMSGETDLMFASLRSGAGLDELQYRCQTMIFGELDWSPEIHKQWIGRLARDREDGVQNHVDAFFLVSEDGSDPPMMEVLGIKASEAKQIVDPGSGLEVIHRDQDRLRKLVERYLTKRG